MHADEQTGWGAEETAMPDRAEGAQEMLERELQRGENIRKHLSERLAPVLRSSHPVAGRDEKAEAVSPIRGLALRLGDHNDSLQNLLERLDV